MQTNIKHIFIVFYFNTRDRLRVRVHKSNIMGGKHFLALCVDILHALKDEDSYSVQAATV